MADQKSVWNEVTLASCIRPATNVLVSQVDDELILLNLESERYFGLDAVGRTFWERLTTSENLAAAVASLQSDYQVEQDQLMQDVDRLLRDLMDRNLVELQSAEPGR